MKLACNIRLVPGETYAEKCALIASYGFEGVELRFLEEDTLPEKVDELENALAHANLRPASIVTINPGFMVPLDSKENLAIKIASAKAAMDLSARFGVGAFVTPEYRAQTPLPLWNGPRRWTQPEEELLYSLMSETAIYAEKVNGFALLEPINRYETHFYYSIQDVMTLIDKVGSRRLKIVIDFFHMNLEEPNIAESICHGAGYIAHVQLGDSNRLLPGRGHTDFVSGFRALNQIGYDRFLALECQVPENPDEELPRCVRNLRGCIEASRTA
jgi:sugar phosphate isomerase/epimerase